VVATEEKELQYLEKIYQIGLQNEIEGLRKITPDEVKEIEPHVECIAA
jgi:L-2-hydroxyglutarate oxidase